MLGQHPLPPSIHCMLSAAARTTHLSSLGMLGCPMAGSLVLTSSPVPVYLLSPPCSPSSPQVSQQARAGGWHSWPVCAHLRAPLGLSVRPVWFLFRKGMIF